jgi:hypothetical protein
MLNALWTEEGGIFNSRAMARRPNPFALIFFTSTARPLMVAAEDAHWRGTSTAGTAQSHDALVGCGLTDNHRYRLARLICSVLQMSGTGMFLLA